MQLSSSSVERGDRAVEAVGAAVETAKKKQQQREAADGQAKFVCFFFIYFSFFFFLGRGSNSHLTLE